MSNKLLLSFLVTSVVIVSGVLLGKLWYTQNPPQTNIAPYTISDPSNGQKIYTDNLNKYEVGFSSTLFTFNKTDRGFSLTSPYYVIENYKGTPDGEVKHPFAINFDYIKKPLIDAIKSYPEFSESMMNSFKDGTAQSFESDESAGTAMVGGKSGFHFHYGVEGTYTDVFVIPISDSETLVIKETNFSDFLASAVKPSPFSEKDEADALVNVLSTIKFRK